MEINNKDEKIEKKFTDLDESFSNNNGHHYMMIKNGTMLLTEDRKKRSSLSEINKFMETVFQDRHLSNEDKVAILKSYHTLTKNFENKQLTGIRKVFFKNKKDGQIKTNRDQLKRLATTKIAEKNGVYEFNLKSEKDVKNITSMIKENRPIISGKNIKITIFENIDIKDLINAISTDEHKDTKVSIKINNDQLTIGNQVIKFQTIETFNKYFNHVKEVKELKEIVIDQPIEYEKDLKSITENAKTYSGEFHIRCQYAFAQSFSVLLKGKQNIYLTGIPDTPLCKILDNDGNINHQLYLYEMRHIKDNSCNLTTLFACIFKFGGDYELKEIRDGETLINIPLSVFSRIENDILKFVIDYSSDLNKQDGYGNTPLLWAIANAEYSNANQLIEKIDKDNLNIVNNNELRNNKITPMHLLVMKGRPNPTSNLGKIQPGITLETLEALLKKGVPLAEDEFGKNAFDYALDKQDFEMIKLFAQYVSPEIVKQKFQKHVGDISDLLKSTSQKKDTKISLLLTNLGGRCGNQFDHAYNQQNKYHNVFYLDVQKAFSNDNLNEIKTFMENKIKEINKQNESN